MKTAPEPVKEETEVPVDASTEAPVSAAEESPKAETAVNETPEEVLAPEPVEDNHCESPKPSSQEEMPVASAAQEEEEAATATVTVDSDNKPEEIVSAAETSTEAPLVAPAEVPEISAVPETETLEVSQAPAENADVSDPAVTAHANDGNRAIKANGEADNKEKLENEKAPQPKKEEDSMPPEADDVVVPPHWHPKPCIHITSIGGSVTEEELSPLFSEFGKIASIAFENERKDAAIIRYETTTAEGEELVAKVKEKLHNTQLGDRTLLIEAFCSDSLLFIGNLTPEIDDALLRKMFEQHGIVERAFVLRNAAGRSKGYGFVEYSLKSQALTAKMAMGNINMDGRVLRVEWSDCKKIADMFSTVLFVDRIPKENPNVEASLRALFGQYGKVRDCHLAIGMNNQYRGFGFIDFYHSLYADMAHQALDGHELEGHSIRVSFANPSKSAQSYKIRFGSQSAPGPYGPGGRGAFPGMMGNAPVRGHMPMPMPGQRYMGPGRSGMMGMGIGMQFGRGSHVGQGLLDQTLPGSGAGMLGTSSAPAGMMARPSLGNNVPPRRATLAPIPRVPGQGHSSINPATIAQVATAQAKAREAKARAGEYYQHQSQQMVDNTFKPVESQYGYQQPYQQQQQQQQTTLPTQYQQQVGQHTQQPYTQYYQQPTQGYIQSQPHQQPQQAQYPQSAPYYQPQPAQQEQAIQPQPYAYAQPYAQQYGQQYGAPTQQQYSQPYNQPTAQVNTQQYQQAAQPQVQTQYSQPYNQPVAQSNAQQYQQMNTVVPATNTAAGIATSQSQDGTQQQAYATYYNQQQQQNVVQVASATAQTSNVGGASQQSLEAQWAAYYASQAVYQQQQAASYPQQQLQQQPPTATSYNEQPTPTPDVGQKRTADQMEAGVQSQMTYNYQQVPASYPQQVPTGAGVYQQNQAIQATGYQQHSAVPLSGYQLQTNAQPYQHQPTAAGYQQPVPSIVSAGPTVPVGDGYQQQQPVAAVAPFQPAPQGQAVNAPAYDYNKRPRF